MKKKLRVAVLMGGKSPEHDISLISGKEVVRNLNPQKYDVLPIVVSRDGVNWQIGDRKQFLLDSPASAKLQAPDFITQSLDRSDHASIIRNNKIDVVFIAMHGPNGEDGTVQGFLELLGISYTGSGVLASALSMDKIYSRKLFTHAGLNVPDYVAITKKDSSNIVWKKFKPPIFIHPHNQGSAIGASIVKKEKQLKKALAVAHSYSDIALVDEYLDGIEVTCAILGNDNPMVLPLIEIVSKKEFFDYEAKYNPELADEIVPAKINKKLTKKAQNTAIVAYKTIGCFVFGRVDMIVKDGDVYVLEVNTIPGLTPVSLFPKAANAAGISYAQLLEKIINLSLEKENP